ncbi:serine protease [Streptomyces fulvoviolaceus]|uniref:serine protease n=1 Tax=Streptomyces fulvoviolaceus TaxID=285535 RepID=UPI0021C01768|nr:serine protease [Streptomyces fulvoviolaceus]MCT9083111.1 serine protease [Streptomyces fulvoviolaceus]
MSQHYWVRISEGDRCLGAGFLVTRAFVLTALHCLRVRSPDNARLDLELPDGRRVSGLLCDEIKDADLALIAVEDAHSHALPLAAPTDWPRPDVRWQSTYRPPGDHTQLSGHVEHDTIDYNSVEGGVFKAIQLRVEQDLGTFAGYSGSPVNTIPGLHRHPEEHGEQARRPVVGILMEEERNREDPSRGTNVLFAASVLHAMERFPQLSMSHLRQQVSVPQPRRPEELAPTQTSRALSAQNLASTDAFLRQLQAWETDGVITPAEAKKERRRAIRQLRRRLLSRSWGLLGRKRDDHV